MNMITVPIQYFGAFRRMGDRATLSVEAGSSARQVKQALARLLGDEHRKLVDASVLADEAGVLSADDVVLETMSLSILPPVCGG